MIYWAVIAVYAAAAATQCVCLASVIRRYRVSLRECADEGSITRSVVVYGEPGAGETCLLVNAPSLLAARVAGVARPATI